MTRDPSGSDGHDQHGRKQPGQGVGTIVGHHPVGESPGHADKVRAEVYAGDRASVAGCGVTGRTTDARAHVQERRLGGELERIKQVHRRLRLSSTQAGYIEFKIPKLGSSTTLRSFLTSGSTHFAMLRVATSQRPHVCGRAH